MNITSYDCIIIGAGPAGLLSAIYLARFKRRVLLIDSGHSRAKLIPFSHNYPGTINGISGVDILKQLENQVKHYSVEMLNEEVINIKKNSSSHPFQVFTQNTILKAKSIVVATGIEDICVPQIKNINEHIKSGAVRHCIICDGYEVSQKTVAVIGDSKHAIKMIGELLKYTDKITFILPIDSTYSVEQDKSFLTSNHIQLAYSCFDNVQFKSENETLITCGNETLSFEAIYLALGMKPHIDFLKELNIQLKKDNQIKVNHQHETSESGVYAIGDVCNDVAQIVTAFGSAAIAATCLHHNLD